jgi:hypothetical protein
MESSTALLLDLAQQIESFQFCSPSEDPDLVDNVIDSFRHLARRFMGHARKIQNPSIQKSLDQLTPDIESISEGMDLQSALEVLIFDIRETINRPISWLVIESEYIAPSIINTLRQLKSSKFDLIKVIEFCEELNGTFYSGYYLATALLIRSLMNHIPPIFGHEKFSQVVSQSTKSRQELFTPWMKLRATWPICTRTTL